MENILIQFKHYFGIKHIQIDKKIFIVCISAAIILTLSEYFDSTSEINVLLTTLFGSQIAEKYNAITLFNADYEFQNLMNWGINCILVFLILPALIIKLIFKEKIKDYGFQLAGIIKHLWIYILLIVIMLPIIFMVSKNPAFLDRYPYYHITSKEQIHRFFVWESIYILQFIAIEFFFRGFLIHGLKHKFGYYSILISMIPYCMIHFGKPMSETLGAIIAGCVLGFLSLNTNSILFGILVHISIALTMDTCAIWRHGFLQ